jgi:hypothetical protein
MRWCHPDAQSWELGPINGHIYRIRPWYSGYRVFQILGVKQTRSQWCSTSGQAREIAEKWAGVSLPVGST